MFSVSFGAASRRGKRLVTQNGGATLVALLRPPSVAELANENRTGYYLLRTNMPYVDREASVLDRVEKSIAKERVLLALHPVLSLQGETVFSEGLARPLDDEGRLIPAAWFADKVEETDLGRELDRVVLVKALEQLRKDPKLRLSINVSARSMMDAAWRQVLVEHLSRYGSLHERLILEISEKSAVQLHELVMRFMADFQPQGLAFCLDQFGAGYTSFHHLKKFLFDFAKIDKSFIRNLDRDPDNQVVVAALRSIANQFDMELIADGIETAAEASMAEQLGLQLVQGYYYGEPAVYAQPEVQEP